MRCWQHHRDEGSRRTNSDIAQGHAHHSRDLDDLWTVVGGLHTYSRAALVAGGARPALVLVHGLGVSSRYMAPLAACLSAEYRVYAPDMPGFGKSDKPRRVLTVPELAAFLARWMDQVGLRRALLLGNSVGCQVIADLAARFPERVAGLVLAGPTFDPAARSLLVPPLRAARDSRDEPPSLLMISLRDYLKAGPRRLICTLHYAQQNRIDNSLRQVRAPVMLLRGAEDRIVPQHWCESLRDMLPGSKLAVIAGASHAAHYSAPTQVASAIRPFLAACSAR